MKSLQKSKGLNPLIIAEIGVNHNGSISLAKKMILEAKKCGADAVKFQAFKATKLVRNNTPLAKYQRKIGLNTQKDLLLKYEMSVTQLLELREFSDKIGIDFMVSVFDEYSISTLKDLSLDVWKVPSGEITNYFLLNELSKTGGSVILSSGMANLDEIDNAIKVLNSNNLIKQITLLHCVTEYPSPLNKINLLSITKLRDVFNLEVGFSDHTEGYTASVYATILGASIIEKHFTLDKNLEGPDHQASLEPHEFAVMVSEIRQCAEMMGRYDVFLSDIEIDNSLLVRKSIVAKENILSGDVFGFNNLTAMRPADGISPMLVKNLIGLKATKEYRPGEVIDLCEINQ
jgi:N,N'-diacetyllegionaminate synthase